MLMQMRRRGFRQVPNKTTSPVPGPGHPFTRFSDRRSSLGGRNTPAGPLRYRGDPRSSFFSPAPSSPNTKRPLKRASGEVRAISFLGKTIFPIWVTYFKQIKGTYHKRPQSRGNLPNPLMDAIRREKIFPNET